MTPAWQVLPVPPQQLGESPFWHPDEARLYWCDIDGRRVNAFDPATGEHRHWEFDHEPGCIAPLLGGGIVVAARDAIYLLATPGGKRRRLARAPYDTAENRFNDGRADACGRLWVTTIFEPRSAPDAVLLRWDDSGGFERMAGDATVGNGIAFSPDGATLYWSDTTAHRIYAFDFDATAGAVSNRRVLAQFPLKAPGQALAGYGGRPDGAAVDIEGCLWVAMYEGARLLRLSPQGAVVDEVALPVRCPTMPCFAGHDLRTLVVTSARHGRPAAELAAEPLAGSVFTMPAPVAGLPVNFVVRRA